MRRCAVRSLVEVTRERPQLPAQSAAYLSANGVPELLEPSPVVDAAAIRQRRADVKLAARAIQPRPEKGGVTTGYRKSHERPRRKAKRSRVKGGARGRGCSLRNGTELSSGTRTALQVVRYYPLPCSAVRQDPVFCRGCSNSILQVQLLQLIAKNNRQKCHERCRRVCNSSPSTTEEIFTQ